MDDSHTNKKMKTQRDKARKERNNAVSERNKAREEKSSAEAERDNANEKFNSSEADNIRLLADQRVRDEFVATLSHDLRNPIGLIKSALSAIEAGIEYKEMLKLIGKAADAAEQLINHLLDANLIKSGEKLPISPREAMLEDVIEECCRSFPEEEFKRLKLRDIDKGVTIFWDIFAMQRAVKNLISNAIKYSDEGSDITIDVASEGEGIKIAVHNFGPTIPLIDQLRIFDGYFRSTSTSHLQQLGWGLGLTLVKGISESHHGKVDLESNEVNGTTFTIRVPRYDLTLGTQSVS